MGNTDADRAAGATWTVTCAIVLGEDRVCLAARRGDPEDPSCEGAVMVYSGPSRGWAVRRTSRPFVSLAPVALADGGDGVCALGKDGHVEVLSPDTGATAAVESISRLIPGNPRKKTYGELTAVRRVGASLFACGASGQVYRRDASGAWAHADEGVLQTGKVGLDDLRIGVDLGGTSERDLYFVTAEFRPEGLVGRLYHHDGDAWSRVEIPTRDPLGAIFVEDADHVWLVGDRSTVLGGSRRQGFGPLLSGAGPHTWSAIQRYRGALFLGSNHGLFRHDEARRRFVKVRTGLDRELGAVCSLGVSGDVLWCAGQGDLARYDGAAWSRVVIPDTI